MIEIYDERYGLTKEGSVYSLRNKAGNKVPPKNPMKIQISNSGYKCVGITYYDESGGKIRTFMTIHRLLAKNFIPNPNNLPEVNHKDGNKLNNSLDNLEWVSKSQNALHAFELGLRVGYPSLKGRFNEKHPLSKPINMLSMEGEVIKTFPSMQEAKRQGFSQGNISSVISGNRKSHKGYKWEYA